MMFANCPSCGQKVTDVMIECPSCGADLHKDPKLWSKKDNGTEAKALEVHGIHKSFGGFHVLKGVTLDVEPHEIVGLIGPNGCGKTTTFNVISGLIPSDSGSVKVFGIDATNLKPYQINRIGLSRTFQNTRLWKDMTVLENLLVAPKDQVGFRIRDAILRRKALKQQERQLIEKAFDILDFLEISHIAFNYASELSGGQSKLVDLGRVLMSDPKLLLLDEPVAGVAGPLANKVFNKIHELRSRLGISVLIIEHNMDFILRKGVDRVFVMNRGEVLVSGTPLEIKKSRDVIEAYLGE